MEHVGQFARHFGRSPAMLGPEEIRAYQVYLAKDKQVAPATLGVAVAALRFLYTVTLQKRWAMDVVIPTPKPRDILPVVLSPAEVVQFLDSIDTAKHRTILTTCYAAGLRISEAVHLTLAAIDSQRMVLRIEQGKGQKDRYPAHHRRRIRAPSCGRGCRRPPSAPPGRPSGSCMRNGPSPVLSSPGHVGRYTHRVAIANQRLLDMDDGHVRFHYKNYRRPRADDDPRLPGIHPAPSATRLAKRLPPHPLLRLARSSASHRDARPMPATPRHGRAAERRRTTSRHCTGGALVV